MSMRDKLHTGELYLPMDDSIMKDQLKRIDRLYDFNATRPTELDKREEMLKEMFAEIGERCYIEPPLHSNFGGGHVHFGKYVYANFNLTMVDDTHIYVGDYTMIGPNVTIASAGHPILPGVTIGDNTVIGAGSVVTKDIPENVVAVGNPCRVLREIGERDREYYFKNRKIDWESIQKDTAL